ncbi:MAG: hypothetical protein DRI86_12670 [Bacteroidetes bacterium]|nr:MAG: hypothetical protein DRI86_12670 [Bacteroidota bacterium]
MKKILIQVVLLVVVVFLGYKVYDSIMEPVRYKKATTDREKIIIKKLNQIKELEIQYKKLNGKYAGSFDTLVDFYLNDDMPLVFKSGVVPDTLTEDQAIEMGLVTRDTTLIAIKDTLLNDVENFDINKLVLVPFTHGKVNFEIERGTVKRANFDVPVFEVRCYKKDYLAGIKEQDLLQNDLLIMNEEEKFPGLKLGSLTEPSTDGNW